jgi:hypothetical protein
MTTDLSHLRAEIEWLRDGAAGDTSIGSNEERMGKWKAYDQVLQLIDGQQERPATKGPTTQDRLDALALQGWSVVHNQPSRMEPIAGSPGEFREREGHARLEKVWKGRTLSEAGDTLERAIASAEWQQRRIEQLDTDNPVSIGTGASAGGKTQ